MRSAALLTRADEPRITVTWDRASIADVVAGFAAFSGRTIILGKDIKGEVNAEIKNQPWPQAFQAILATQGLSAQEMPGGIIRVDAPVGARRARLARAAGDQHRPDQLRPGRLARQDGREHPDQGPRPRRRRHRLQRADPHRDAEPDRQTSPSSCAGSTSGRRSSRSRPRSSSSTGPTSSSSGLKYDLGSKHPVLQQAGPADRPDDRRSLQAGTSTSSTSAATRCRPIGNADATITGSALDLVFSTAIGGFSLTTFLSALERTELADIQAEPVITTLDNRQADILVGEETPVRVIDAVVRRRRARPRPTCSSRRPVSVSRSRRTSPTTGRS